MPRATPAVIERAVVPEISPEGSPGRNTQVPVVDEAYRSFQAGLRAYLRSRVNDAALAEDLLQEVFLKLMRSLDKGDKPANLGAWLYRIAGNTLIDHYRRQRLTSEMPDNLEAAEPFSLPPEHTLALCLKPFIEQLPPIYRDALLATAIEGHSLADWGRTQGLSPSAVKSRVSRGRAMLRIKVLECCHVEAARSGEVLSYWPRE